MPETSQPRVGSKRYARHMHSLVNATTDALSGIMGRQGDNGECPCDCAQRHPRAKYVCAEYTQQEDAQAAQNAQDGSPDTTAAQAPVCHPCRTAAIRWSARRTGRALSAMVVSLVLATVIVWAAVEAIGRLLQASTWADRIGTDAANASANASANALVGIAYLVVVAIVWAAALMTLPPMLAITLRADD